MQHPLLAQYVNAAHAANQQGQPVKAVEYSQLALALNPGIAEAWFNLGIAQARLGQKTNAIAALEQARLRCLDSAEGQNSIGLHMLELDALESAETCLQQAIKLAPHYAYAHSNLGKLYRKRRSHDMARQQVLQAIALAPNEPLLHVNLAGIYLDLKQHEQAEQAARKAIELAPKQAQAWINLSTALYRQHQLGPAETAVRKALELTDQIPEAWETLGAIKIAQFQYKTAEVAYRKVLELAPESAEVLSELGMGLKELKRFDEALTCLGKAYDIAPELEFLLTRKLMTQASVCDWTNWKAGCSTLAAGIQQGTALVEPWGLFALLDAPQLHRMATERYTRHEFPSQDDFSPRKPQAQARIRIGYFSADFREHPVAQLLVELLELHDHSRIETVGYSLSPASSSPLRQRLTQAFDQFIDASSLSDTELIQTAREQHLDIAINLGGYTTGNRSTVFAHRVAPVQVNYLGFPGTMGAGYMDYLITDPVVCPSGSEAWYTEKLARLPHCFMPHDSQQVIADRTPLRSEFDLPEQGFVFCCFNNHYKINPDVFALWMRLLLQVDGSVLWLSDGPELVKSNLRRSAATHGVAPDRLLFAQRVNDMPDHLARHRLADLFLDTLPYNAHTTASDALWAGVPVLTCAGQGFVGRVAASLLHAAGLPELVTDSPQAYEALALELARNPARLQTMRDKLVRQGQTTPLFDTPRLAQDMEKLFAIMHQRSVNGLPPEDISMK